jgi:hypothetical protein
VNFEELKKDFKQEANKVLANFGINLNKDSDNDGIADIKDSNPKDFNNFTKEEQKELFGNDYNTFDKIKDSLGMAPGDTDKDGVPNSYETKKSMSVDNVDSDDDGIYDGEEIVKGLNPINADEDKDGVLDGRDAYPTDQNRSVFESDKDTDGDGVSDRFESYIRSNVYVKDTDSDGLSDAVDGNVTVSYKISKSSLPKDVRNDLTFGIQNNFISFFADMLYILIFVSFLFFIYVFRKWFTQISHDVDHYYHMFHNAYGFKHDDKHGSTHHENFKNIKHEVKNGSGNNNHSITKEINHSEKLIEPIVFLSSINGGEERWDTVTKYMNDDLPDMWKLGIIEADTMLDEALKNIGYMGGSLGDRLKSANFRSIDLAWEAHRVRNNIAHAGINFNLTEREARKTFVMYETVLKDLKVI